MAQTKRTYVVVCELDSRNHDDSSVAGLGVIVADERALTRTALLGSEVGHPELRVGLGVDGCGVEDGDPVPARLDLEGKVVLEATGRLGVVEDLLKGRVFEGGSVDVSGDPVVVEDGRPLQVGRRDISNRPPTEEGSEKRTMSSWNM